MLQTAKVDRATGNPRSQVEQRLVAAAKSGDSGAFETLVAMYRRRVSRVAFMVTRNHEDSEDVTQMVFLKASTRLQSFEGRSSFLTWLTRIAVNESLMQIRRRGKITISLDDVPDGEEQSEKANQIQDASPTPEQSYSFAEMQAFLASALEQLSPSSRIAFELYVEGYTGKETAEFLGSSVASVKTHLCRARAALRSQITRWLSDVRQSGKTPYAALTRAC